MMHQHIKDKKTHKAKNSYGVLYQNKTPSKDLLSMGLSNMYVGEKSRFNITKQVRASYQRIITWKRRRLRKYHCSIKYAGKHNMNAIVHMYQIGRDIKAGYRI